MIFNFNVTFFVYLWPKQYNWANS